MNGGGGGGAPPPSPTTGGQFLLHLLQKPQSQNPITSTPSQSHTHTLHNNQHLDPAVAAMGPTLPFSSNGHDPPPWFNPITNFPQFPSNTPWGILGLPPPPNSQFVENHPFVNDDLHRLGVEGKLGNQQKKQNMMMFGSVACEVRNHEGVLNGNLLDQRSREVDRMNVETQFGVKKNREVMGASGSSKSSEIWSNSNQNWEFDRHLNSNSNGPPHQWNNYSNHDQRGGGVMRGGEGRGRQQQHAQSRRSNMQEPRSAPPPPGFPHQPKGLDQRGFMNARRELEHNVDKEVGRRDKLNHGIHPSYNKDEMVRNLRRGIQSNASSRVGPPVESNLRSVPALDIEESLATMHGQVVEENVGGRLERRGIRNGDEGRSSMDPMSGHSEQDDLAEQLMDSIRLRDGFEKNSIRHYNNSHDKDFRSDVSRELWAPGQRMRNHRRVVDCRNDIDRMNAPLLAIYESLVPAEEEKAKQKQLLTSLEKLVNKEWPKAQLYLYGSCANSFGVSNSDIDVCLSIEDEDINKSELLLKLADILKSDNLQNVQALTRARVPIVKLMDPVTGISCDICVNNVLAVVNTKLLRDYAQIDGRLRQLAFIVKHWAKSRGVNVTYQGTLSSYAYVLMCIHFLQQRKPAILPCLQGMEATYVVTVDDVECAYFDQVQNLRDFGAQNKETIAQLVWAFFDYWAYCHDYANTVISVRTGSIISKRTKDWTRRIGNDRHLICIEDPFVISHDLGRVVDKYSIKVLREEFERAANILQYDPDPCVALFEPYVPS